MASSSSPWLRVAPHGVSGRCDQFWLLLEPIVVVDHRQLGLKPLATGTGVVVFELVVGAMPGTCPEDEMA